jgi:hypothetical protein
MNLLLLLPRRTLVPNACVGSTMEREKEEKQASIINTPANLLLLLLLLHHHDYHHHPAATSHLHMPMPTLPYLPPPEAHVRPVIGCSRPLTSDAWASLTHAADWHQLKTKTARLQAAPPVWNALLVDRCCTSLQLLLLPPACLAIRWRILQTQKTNPKHPLPGAIMAWVLVLVLVLAALPAHPDVQFRMLRERIKRRLVLP